MTSSSIAHLFAPTYYPLTCNTNSVCVSALPFFVWESGYTRIILSPCFWNTLPVGRTIHSQSSTVAIVTCSMNDAAKGRGRWSHWWHYWHHQWGHYFPNHYLNLLIFPYLFLAILSCLCNLIVPTYSLQSYRAYIPIPCNLIVPIPIPCNLIVPIPIPCNLIVPTYSLQSYRAYSLQSYCAYLFPAILLCVPISCNPIMPTYSLQSYSAYLFPAILSCLPIPCNLVMPSSFS